MDRPYDRVLRTIERSDADVRFAVRCGSHVYGTNGPLSDEDYFVVLADKKAKQDLAWGPNMNVIVHGGDVFEKALADQSVFALECFFAPTEHRLKEATQPFAFKRDNRRLIDSAKSRSDSDFAKAAKRYEDEPEPSRKKVFHSLRVLAFARQVCEKGRIFDYGAANDWWLELSANPDISWPEVDRRFGAIRSQLLVELERNVRR